MADAAEPPRQLPTYTTLLLMHALRAIFSPSNFIYPVTARFLLQRPTLDTTDVPMLFGMLYSSSDDNWKKERGWMIRFLADGMVGSEDWRVLKRRHTWDLLASLFQSTDAADDNALRLGVLEVNISVFLEFSLFKSLILVPRFSRILPAMHKQRHR
jgi:nucleolar pre-ribosomal-associated protein 1